MVRGEFQKKKVTKIYYEILNQSDNSHSINKVKMKNEQLTITLFQTPIERIVTIDKACPTMISS